MGRLKEFHIHVIGVILSISRCWKLYGVSDDTRRYHVPKPDWWSFNWWKIAEHLFLFRSTCWFIPTSNVDLQIPYLSINNNSCHFFSEQKYAFHPFDDPAHHRGRNAEISIVCQCGSALVSCLARVVSNLKLLYNIREFYDTTCRVESTIVVYWKVRYLQISPSSL